MSADEAARVSPAGPRGGALGLVLAAALSGCAYTSHYAPPPDGRARAVWEEDRVVVEVAAPMSPQCRDAIDELVFAPFRRRAFAGSEPAYWSPRYYGPAIIVTTPGLAPPLPLYPLFLPHRLVLRALAHGVGAPGASVPGAPIVHGGGDELGKAAVALAVVALAVLPVVDVSLALANPENGRASVEAISQVSAFNDLARQPGSPCSAPTEFPAADPGGAP